MKQRTRPVFWETGGWPVPALLPVSCLFGGVSRLRAALYRQGVLRVSRLPVPVIVVGNIAVGGSGKTPVVSWLVAWLRAHGRTPGIISRGYGGRLRGPVAVGADARPVDVGDEPVLLASLTGCPVVIGADRVAAAHHLLQTFPECDVLVSDDGLQHYRLPRTVEIAVVDESVLGNHRLLPAGPLREAVSRLASVDVVIAHGELSVRTQRAAGQTPVFGMRLEGQRLYPVVPVSAGRLEGAGQRQARPLPLEALRGLRVHAVAGIGRPARFFDELRAAGLEVIEHPFADHHAFSAGDLRFDDALPCVMTSKDAVKCRSFAPPDTWELPVRADIADAAGERILEILTHGRQTA